MTKKIKSIFALLLTAVFLFTAFPINASADSTMTVTVSTKNAMAGSTVDIDVMVSDNPGVAAISFDVDYDKDNLTLMGFTYNTDALAGASTTPYSESASVPCLYMVNGSQNITGDFTFATLTFKVKENAKNNTTAYIKLNYDPDNVYDIGENNISCDITNGAINIIACIPGDINGDEKVNSKDVSRLMQYHAHWDVKVNEPALDTNGDNKLNSKDVTRLMQYLAHWDVVLYPIIEQQDIKAVSAKAATCEDDGNIAYWYDTAADKYYRDASCLQEISYDDTIIKALGHSPVTVHGYPPTTEIEGLTDGVKCSVCGKWLQEQTVIPQLTNNEYAITYKLVNNDNYLATQNIVNPNQNSYVAGKGLNLSNDLFVPGYTFAGWFDSFADNATQIKYISADEERNITLYAHWIPNEYRIQFESDLIPVSDDHYTVNQAKTLPTPRLSGYSFVGWSDDEGTIIKRIPIGTTGDKTFTANWLSNRNQAVTYKNVDEPIILEEDNKILFAYEIGEIRNVPISVIHDFGKIVSGGVASEQTVTHSKTVSVSEVKNYSKTVANATTENYGITLSNGWSDGMSVSQEFIESNQITEEEAVSRATNESNNWYVSSGRSGSSTTTTFNTTDTTKMNTATSNDSNTSNSSGEGAVSSTHTKEDHSDFGFEESVKVGGDVGPVKLEGGLKASQSFGSSDSNSFNQSYKNAYGTSATVSKGGSDQEGTVTHTGSNTSSTGSWNSESGRGGSTSVTDTVSTSKIISESISEKTGYGKSFIKTGSETTNQGFSSQQTTSDSYSTGITYSTSESESYTETISTTNTIEGYHRWVWATTAHVFLIVGYDIATSSYFTCNYSILDEDNVKRFEDYSYDTASYDDNQTGVITFEIPTDIKDYVTERVSGSEGLQYSRDGKITGYTGNDDFVIIPEYKVINGTVIKVTGIAKNAFKGKVKLQNGIDEFLGLELSEYITEIEDSTFENCSALKYIDLKNVTSIGDNAFSGCNGLKITKLNDNVTHLGQDAFENLDALLVYASNKSVAEAAVNSGAKAIALIVSDKCDDLEDVSLTVPLGTTFFGFYGSDSVPRTFGDVTITSNADETLILNANFEFTRNKPIILSSNIVTWGESNVTSPYFCAVFTAENTLLSVYGESTFNSQKGDAILAKNLSLTNINDELFSQFHLCGNVLVCGGVTGNDFLSFTSGEVKVISEDEFSKYLKGSFEVTFNPTGGVVSVTKKSVIFGETYGELPLPIFEYKTFVGWFTDSEGGTEVKANTIATSSEDQILYAHWVDNETSDWVLVSEIPDDAKIVDEKWTYLQKETTSSGSSSKDGWIRYDKQRTGWGSTQGPVYSDPSNGSRNVWSERYVTSSNYKTVYHYYRYAAQREGGYGSYERTSSYPNYYQLDLDSPLEQTSSINGHARYMWWYSGSNWVGMYECSPYTTQEWVSDNYGTRWYYQEPVYTYYYYRYVERESAEKIEPSETVSSVVHWVKYISKNANDTTKTEFDALILNMDSKSPIENNQGNVIIGTENHSAAQVWHFFRNDDGSYRITSCYDGKAIDLDGSGTENGTNISMYNAHGGNNQCWYLQEFEGGYNIIPKCSPNGAMDLTNGDTVAGTNVQFYKWNGTSAQLFEVVIVPELNEYLA